VTSHNEGTISSLVWPDYTINYSMCGTVGAYLTQLLASLRIESRVTPGRMRPSRGAVAISGSVEVTASLNYNTFYILKSWGVPTK